MDLNSKRIIKRKEKIILNFKLPANVQNPEKALECLGGSEKIYKVAKLLNKYKK